MIEFTLKQVENWTNGTASCDVVLCAVSTDSRNILENCLFLPLVGERFDAHDFIQQAIANGAAAVLSARDLPDCPVPVVRVADTSQALLDLAAGYRAQFDCPVVAVTGSVGKTTTKGMLGAVLSQRYCTLKTAGNRNNTIGMPLTALEMDQTTEAVVLEMGMNHFGEIACMTASAQPNIAIINTIGTSHIEHLGSREGICRAKMEILEGLAARSGVAILNGDEPLLWAQKDRLYGRVIWFGQQNGACDVRATDVQTQADRVTFTLQIEGESTPVTLHLAGAHNVTNALAAAACGWLLGLEGDEIAQGLGEYIPEGSRQNLYQKHGFSIYEDCYNASPDSMQAALAVLRDMPATRRHAVLGDMLELGDYAKEAHIQVGKWTAHACDHLWVYGAWSVHTAQGAREAGLQNIQEFTSHQALADALRAVAQTGDALLFKGSHSMHMERALALFLGEEV